MAQFTLYHNPNCSTSRHAVDVATRLGADVDVVQYLKSPLDADALRSVLAQLDEAPTVLVRRDSFFGDQGLTDQDVETVDQVVAVLVEHPRLMQRPLLVGPNGAIIGRPKDRVEPFLQGR